ncbi:MAG: efflux RND transporter periplasmic adaptor subunit [Acidobacteriota bacterium]
MSRGLQRFSILVFSLLAAGITLFITANPLELPFLPQVGRGRSRTDSAPSSGTGSGSGDRKTEQTSSERKILYWYAPMDPTYIRNEPGISPMGMPMVPKYADQAGGAEEGVIRIDPVQIQNTGVSISLARLGTISRLSRTVGILDFDADRVTWINTKYSGWVEKVNVTYVGQRVHRGKPLFEIYSPDLVSTQEEYLRALDYAASLKTSNREEARQQAASLLRSTRERLSYWDIDAEQIKALQSRHKVDRTLKVVSPVDGTVVEVMSDAIEGMYVKPGMNLYKIADLSSLWVHADVYESDLGWVRAGQPVEVSLSYGSTQKLKGHILFLYPQISEETRTLKICVEVPNPEERLRPGMYTDITLKGPPVHDAVRIPNSAVLRSGERDLVFVSLGHGRFAPREVTLGLRGEEDVIQVLEGVEPGDEIVTQAQFMLDSESRVQEAIAKFMSRRSPAAIQGVQKIPEPEPAGHQTRPSGPRQLQTAPAVPGMADKKAPR